MSIAEVGQGPKLFWSFLSEEQAAGRDVYAMAIEAYRAPFEQQVIGFIKGARSRAVAVLKRRDEYWRVYEKI